MDESDTGMRFYNRVNSVERIDATHIKISVQSGKLCDTGIFPLHEAIKMFEGLRRELGRPAADVIPLPRHHTDSR
jgi:hypothetical protein